MPDKQYIIMKASRRPPNGKAAPRSAYRGPACEAAGVMAGQVYDSLKDAIRDAVLLTRVNPVGFVVWKVGAHEPIET